MNGDQIRRLSLVFNEFPSIRDSSVRLTAGRSSPYETLELTSARAPNPTRYVDKVKPPVIPSPLMSERDKGSESAAQAVKEAEH